MQAPAADKARPPPLRIDVSCPDQDTAVVTPAGEADIFATAGLRRALCDAIRTDCPHVIVDLDHLTFMDASTLGVLVAARLRTAAAGNSLRVRCHSRRHRRLLRMTGLGGMLDPGE